MSRNIFQQLYYKDLDSVYRSFNGIIFDNVIGEIDDLQNYFEDVHEKLSTGTRILVSYHNPIWEPILTFASRIGLRKRVGNQNWIDKSDLKNVLEISGFEIIKSQSRFFNMTQVTIARAIKQVKDTAKKYSVSIIVPARNEEGNISKIVPAIPKIGKFVEFIFVEGHSKDNTWEKIIKETKKYKNVKALRQHGRGKADAVWLGFSKAKGDVLMIYDADMTVNPNDLAKFYKVFDLNLGEFANGSRLVYPMENQAMQTLNKIGNKIFSKLFTFILGQCFKDTLCGTKALFRKDYLFMKKHNKNFFDMDPFGDFALIFGAIRNNLKVVEIPIRYRDRTYGKTNISRFTHGALLFKMTIKAFKEFKLS